MISEQWDTLWARLHGSPFILLHGGELTLFAARHIKATTVEGICQDCNITRVLQLGQNVVVSTPLIGLRSLQCNVLLTVRFGASRYVSWLS